MTDGAYISPLQESAKVTTGITLEGPGPRLKAAREAAGLQIKDVALHLRLSPSVITQIDQDIYDPEIAQVFMKGYLRAYAKLIGLNGDEVIAEYLGLVQEEERDLSQLVAKPVPRTRSMPAINVQARPSIFWGSSVMLTIAFVGMLWAYTAQPGSQSAMAKASQPQASLITEEVVNKVAKQEPASSKPAEKVAAKESQPAAPANEPALPKPTSADSEESLLF